MNPHEAAPNRRQHVQSKHLAHPERHHRLVAAGKVLAIAPTLEDARRVQARWLAIDLAAEVVARSGR